MSNNFTKTLIAAEDIPACRLVKYSEADNTVVLATAGTDNVLGVNNDVDVKAGNTIDITPIGVEKVQFGEAVTRGSKITAGVAGKAVNATESDNVIGVAFDDAVDNDIALAILK